MGENGRRSFTGCESRESKKVSLAHGVEATGGERKTPFEGRGSGQEVMKSGGREGARVSTQMVGMACDRMLKLREQRGHSA